MPDDSPDVPSSPATQITWGRGYIRDRYGQAAERPYDAGGILPAGFVTVRNGSDEAEEVKPRDPSPEDVEVTCAGGLQLPAIGVSDGSTDDQE